MRCLSSLFHSDSWSFPCRAGICGCALKVSKSRLDLDRTFDSYYYDLLVGLDFITRLGFSHDRRLDRAFAVLKQKRRANGRWNLDAVHPDVEVSVAEWYAKHPEKAPKPFALERAGAPSKMITVRAMQVLHRLGEFAF